MNIFVTGATGYLGHHFVIEAKKRGHNILCLRRKTSISLFDDETEKEITWVTAGSNLRKELSEFHPDVLFHAAWNGVRGEGRDDTDIQDKNVVMSDTIFKLYPYKQIISIGSQAEYGYYSHIISENASLNPNTEYGKAKIQCCENLKSYCQRNKIEWQWIRIFTVFGEKQTGGLVKLAIEKCLSGAKIFDTTWGEQRYSYLYAEDFAKAICNILGGKGKSGIYNLSQPECILSNRELLTTIKNLSRSSIHLNFGAIPYNEGQVMYMDGSVEKFEKSFGKIPHTDMLTAMNKTIESFKTTRNL